MLTVRDLVIEKYSLGKRPRWRSVWCSMAREDRSEIWRRVLNSGFRQIYVGGLGVLVPESNQLFALLPQAPEEAFT